MNIKLLKLINQNFVFLFCLSLCILFILVSVFCCVVACKHVFIKLFHAQASRIIIAIYNLLINRFFYETKIYVGIYDIGSGDNIIIFRYYCKIYVCSCYDDRYLCCSYCFLLVSPSIDCYFCELCDSLFEVITNEEAKNIFLATIYLYSHKRKRKCFKKREKLFFFLKF